MRVSKAFFDRINGIQDFLFWLFCLKTDATFFRVRLFRALFCCGNPTPRGLKNPGVYCIFSFRKRAFYTRIKTTLVVLIKKQLI